MAAEKKEQIWSSVAKKNPLIIYAYFINRGCVAGQKWCRNSLKKIEHNIYSTKINCQMKCVYKNVFDCFFWWFITNFFTFKALYCVLFNTLSTKNTNFITLNNNGIKIIQVSLLLYKEFKLHKTKTATKNKKLSFVINIILIPIIFESDSFQEQLIRSICVLIRHFDKQSCSLERSNHLLRCGYKTLEMSRAVSGDVVAQQETEKGPSVSDRWTKHRLTEITVHRISFRMVNATMLGVFTLSGLKDTTTKYRVVLFSLNLICYGAILLVNTTLILTIVLEDKLHKPMYIFLCNLCFNSLYGTAAFHPKFLFDLLAYTHVISHTGCLLQVFFIYSYASTDFSILAVMAYDRYLAICCPLEYHAIMTKQRTAFLVCFSRLVPLVCQSVAVIMSSSLTLCDSHIDKLYCDNWSVLLLSCHSTTSNNIVGYLVILLYFFHAVFIMCSYVQLLKFSLKYRDRRKKFLQTCTPHLFCLLNVTAALLFDLMYARYGSKSMAQSLRNFMAIQFLIIPPLFNPIIYGLNLTQVRRSFLRLTKKVID